MDQPRLCGHQSPDDVRIAIYASRKHVVAHPMLEQQSGFALLRIVVLQSRDASGNACIVWIATGRACRDASKYRIGRFLDGLEQHVAGGCAAGESEAVGGVFCYFCRVDNRFLI